MPTEQYELQDTDPTVSMDINLGKHLEPGQVVDFDYDAYRTTIGRLDHSQSDISDLHVRVADSVPGGYNGIYHPDTNSIDIRLRSHNMRGTGQTLRHETQHYLDNRANVLHMNPTLHALGDLALRPNILYPNAALQNANALAQVALPNVDTHTNTIVDSVAHVVHNPYVQAGILATGVLHGAAAASGYYLNKPERHARKAGRVKAPDVIKLRQK